MQEEGHVGSQAASHLHKPGVALAAPQARKPTNDGGRVGGTPAQARLRGDAFLNANAHVCGAVESLAHTERRTRREV